jgi:lysozyme
MKRRINKKNCKNEIPYRLYYWLTGAIILLSVFFFFRTSLIMYYYIIKDNFTIHELGNGNFQKSIKISEADKIQAVFKKYKSYAFGLDISQHQGKILWDSVQFIHKDIPISFVFVRATRGAFTQDAFFKKNWKNLSKKRILKGAYHYYDVNKNSTIQAENFIKTVTLKKGDLPPVLDVEDLPKKQSLELLKSGLINWLNLVEKKYKIKPIIYSNDFNFIHHISDLDLKDYIIWTANYNPIESPLHQRWIFWQFTEKGVVKGFTQNFVDINVFNGSIEELQKLTL